MTPRELVDPRPPSGLPRSLEIALAFACLIAFMPLLLLLALAIVLVEKQPALFLQQRVGYRGELFIFYKLRTMKTASAGPMVTAAGDARVTGIGKFLRRTKLDELPSLWNVIKGDMCLVGPRPEVPQYVDMNSPDWRMVLEVKPGITDPVTASLRNEESLLAEVRNNPEVFYLETLQEYKLRGYLEYLSERSCWTDLKILTKTCAVVIFPFWSRRSITTRRQLRVQRSDKRVFQADHLALRTRVAPLTTAKSTFPPKA